MGFFEPTIRDRLLSHVRDNPRQVTKLSDLAKDLGAAHPSLKRVLYDLVDDGLITIVESRRGRGGGVVLEVA